jgi:hypothetical protein
MRHLKARLFAIVLIFFAGLTYLSWHELLTTGRYSLKMAALRRWELSGDCSSWPFRRRWESRRRLAIRSS